MSLARYPNFALRISKWPIALLMITLLPASVMSLLKIGVQVLGDLDSMVYCLLGAGLYLVLDYTLFSKRFMGSSFSTFEHELTHALFAWMTLHRVTKLKVTWSSGGMVEIVGGGNWLISLAPYWFPTLCVPFMLMSQAGQFTGMWWVSASLGASYCYHLLSTWRETHREQTDIQQTGFLFAWLFLPSANIIMTGVILAFAQGGVDGAIHFIAKLTLTYQEHLSYLG